MPADVPGDISSTSTVNVGGSVTGLIETIGDVDYFRVNLVAGATCPGIPAQGLRSMPRPEYLARQQTEDLLVAMDVDPTAHAITAVCWRLRAEGGQCPYGGRQGRYGQPAITSVQAPDDMVRRASTIYGTTS